MQKLIHFFLVKIVIGIAVIGGSVFCMEWLGRLLLSGTRLSDDAKNISLAIADAAIASLSYIVLFRTYEKRQIKELRASAFGKNAITGFAIGIMLQSIFILVIYVAGGYSVIHINSLSSLIPAFAPSFTAGFVAEILLVGVVFRITEEKCGTAIALIILALFFAVMHINAKHASFMSVCATATQAGFMLPAAYLVSRTLWLPIFLHCSWDFAEPGIYGGINPGNSLDQSLLASKINGSLLIAGGQTGPQNTIQAFICCLALGFLFIWLAKQKNNIIKPSWKN